MTLDLRIKYDMERYAHFLKRAQGLNALEMAIEETLTGRRPSPQPTAEVPLSIKPEKHDHDHAHEHVKPTSSRDVGDHYVTSPYGMRVHPKSHKRQFHSGIDLRGKEGAPVYSFEDGVVKKVGYSKLSGNYIIIDHGDELTSSYSHLSQQDVKPGQEVKAGEQIGLVGSTGNVTGPHLHFNLRFQGKHLDPTPFLTTRRVVG